MDIDAIIAEASIEAPEATATEVAPKAETPEPEKVEVQEEDLSQKSDEELTPEQLEKREQNRQSHRNSREAKLRREVRELREYRAQQEAKAQAKPTPVVQDLLSPPKESDYNSFMDFLEAKDKYREALFDKRLEDKLQELQPKESEKVDPIKAQRIQEVGAKAVEFMDKVPEYKALYQQNAEFFQGLPKAIEDALFDADDAPLALYALMKEDKLFDLEGMTPNRIAMELGKAEERGKSYLNPPKPVTNAPQPFPKAGRVTSGGKSLDNMSPDEILNLVRNN